VSCCRTELQNIQQSLVIGEREKIELMKSLACLKVGTGTYCMVALAGEHKLIKFLANISNFAAV
jgi:hypothetical protein